MSLTIESLQPFAIAALAIVVGLASPLAQAGAGDLDASFADHGRLGPIPRANGHATSVELREVGGILVGGGDIDVSGSLFGGPFFSPEWQMHPESQWLEFCEPTR